MTSVAAIQQALDDANMNRLIDQSAEAIRVDSYPATMVSVEGGVHNDTQKALASPAVQVCAIFGPWTTPADDRFVDYVNSVYRVLARLPVTMAGWETAREHLFGEDPSIDPQQYSGPHLMGKITLVITGSQR